MKNRIAIFVSMLIIVSSCSKLEVNNNVNNNDSAMESLNVLDNFSWETSKSVNVNLSVLDNNNAPISNVRLSLYTDDPESGGKLIFSGVTDNYGSFSRAYEFPSYFDSVSIVNNYIGINNMIRVAITGESVNYTFGGEQATSQQKSAVSSVPKNATFNYLGTYNSYGVPNYLEPQNDIIDADFLNDVNNSLPEEVELPVSHPQYLNPGNSYDLSLIEPCDVWVTFVHEGAGYKNTLGFYTYPTNNPPSGPNDIDEITIIFPNVSYLGSGGGLVSGNKVKIGSFPTGTSIGWVLFPNAWYSGRVNNTSYTYYSNPDFNPESVADLRQHTVLVNDIGRSLILLGLEDLNRQGSCDHDFNDAIFYITANPIQAIDNSNLPVMDYEGEDEDNDGVTDNMDDYPDDPDKAFNNYFFSEGTYGTLAYEDMWPGTGDYDFNDMVIDYNFNQITNADNKVVEIEGEFVLKAFGASFHNGFGIDLGISQNMVSSVTGYKTQESWVNLNSKGLEVGQSNAVIIVFDDTYHLMAHAGGIGVNTSASYPFVTPDTTRISITLNQPVELESIGVPPYNPFMIVNQDRTHEIHLPNHAPTDFASTTLFNTFRDDSNPAIGRYYKTDNNLPWAIKTLEPFEYPYEKVEILQAYLKFAEWAESSGYDYSDWYKNEVGYRNEGNIYQQPN